MRNHFYQIPTVLTGTDSGFRAKNFTKKSASTYNAASYIYLRSVKFMIQLRKMYSQKESEGEKSCTGNRFYWSKN